MSVVFHIAARAEWEAAVAAGAYRTASLDTEGFIHCSTGEQVAGTANTLFARRTDLVLLFIDVERLEPALRYEPVADPPGAVFPHVFGPINLAAVFEVVTLQRAAEGRFDIPLEVPALAAVGDRTAEQTETRAMATMDGYRAPWWIAGGWAIELRAAAHGGRIRPHADLEISILRRDQRALFDHLVGWQLCAVVRSGVLEDWDGQLGRDGWRGRELRDGLRARQRAPTRIEETTCSLATSRCSSSSQRSGPRPLARRHHSTFRDPALRSPFRNRLGRRRTALGPSRIFRPGEP